MLVKSNYDCLHDNIETLKSAPSFFKNELWKDIEGKLRTITYLERKEKEKIEGKGVDLYPDEKNYLNQIISEVQAKEKDFREHIQEVLKEKGLTTDRKRRKAVREDPNYNWISKVYPEVNLEDAKVIFMTVDKLMTMHSPIISNGYQFISKKFLKDSVVFIDEFDASKEVMIKNIIDAKTKLLYDYLSLFRKINTGFHNRKLFSKQLYTAEGKIKQHYKYNFESLKKECKMLYDKYQLEYTLKSSIELRDDKKNFLFDDAEMRTVISAEDNKGKDIYVVLSMDDENQRVLIDYKTKDEYKSKDKQLPTISEMVISLENFIRYFSVFISMWGEKYAEDVNKSRREKAAKFDIEEEMMSQEKGVRSVLDKFGFTSNELDVIMESYKANTRAHVTPTRHMPYSYFTNGFQYYEFIDDDNHNDSTRISRVRIQETPEGILCFMAKNANVIGISATATMPSVVSNYNLNYLKDELQKNYHEIIKEDSELFKKIKEKIDYEYKPFKEGNNKTDVIRTRTRVNGPIAYLTTPIKDEAVYSKDYAEICCKEIDNAITFASSYQQPYYRTRYLNIAKVMKDFVSNRGAQSFLYLGMSSAKKQTQNATLKVSVLEKLMKNANADEGIEKDDPDYVSLFNLTGNNFDLMKENMAARLKNGDRLFITSTYKTIGAGQNLQHETSGHFMNNLVKLRYYSKYDKRGYDEKDIDGIYLGDITHTFENTAVRKDFNSKNLLNHIIQAEELYENGEISRAQKNRVVKEGFTSVSKNDESIGRRNELANCRGIVLQKTRDVIQAIGRMGRTHLRNKNIHIFIDDRVIDNLDKSVLSKMTLTPEMQAIYDSMDGNGFVNDDMRQLVNCAYKISQVGAGAINNFLRDFGNLTVEDLLFWKNLRMTCLKYPNADEALRNKEENELIRKFYIKANTAISSYRYAVTDDKYRHLAIDFGDEAIFKKDIEELRKDGDKPVQVAVSEEDAQLDILMKNIPLKNFFEENGFATHFHPAEYILTPVLYNNIYKGMLGETAGKFLVENFSQMRLEEIQDSKVYEFFDFKIKGRDNEYVDFKHWHTSETDQKKMYEHIIDKMKEIGAKKVYIIGVVKPKVAASFHQTISEYTIVTVPYLINRDGTVATEMMDKLN